MEIDIRPIGPSEYEAFVHAVERAFGHYPRPGEMETWKQVTEFDRTLAAYDGSEIVGTAEIYSMVLTIPGGELPMAGVAAVGVAPTHRRRGLLTSMMRRQLSDIRERGEGVAGLWASEGSIYGRFGYGAAALSASFEIDRGRTAFARTLQPRGRVTLLGKEQALEVFPPVFDQVRPRIPGMWARTPEWWRVLLADLEAWRDGASALFFALHESETGPDGYVMYRVKSEWEAGGPKGTLRVVELIAETAAAYADLWRYCFDVDLIARIEAWPRPVDEPLFHMLAEPRRMGLRFGDGLWVRVVDVRVALAARRYATSGNFVVEVRDSFCPWNEGRFELAGGPQGAECRRTDRPADLSVEAADLGAAYLGGVRFSVLERAGRVHELTPGALSRADAMFSWDPLPWCPRVF